MTKETYIKYPNDYRVIEKYILELFNDPNYPNEPFGEEVHKDELFRLCKNVLEYCTTQKIRYTAMDILSTLYVNDGRTDKAKEIYEQFPESVYDTVSELHEQMYRRCDSEKYTEFIKKNLRYTAEHLINKIGNFGTFAATTVEDKIRACQKCISLIELIYDDGDYGFAYYHLGHIHCLIVKLYYRVKDNEMQLCILKKDCVSAKYTMSCLQK